jgi:hypothetical protein
MYLACSSHGHGPLQVYPLEYSGGISHSHLCYGIAVKPLTVYRTEGKSNFTKDDIIRFVAEFLENIIYLPLAYRSSVARFVLQTLILLT